MAKSHRMTPARRAALKKAQAASARKRRGKGRGKLASANKQVNHYKRNQRRQAMAYTAIGLAGAALYAGAKYSEHRARNKRSAATFANNQKRWKAMTKDYASRSTRGKIKYRGKDYHITNMHSGPANRHNRVFVTTRRGTTSVRKRY